LYVKGISGHNNLFNRKLQNLEGKNYQVISLNLTTLKSDLLEDDGVSLTQRAINEIGSRISKTLQIPKSTKVNDKSATSSLHVSNMIEVPKGCMGKIIGRQGNIIKSLTEKHGVKMSTGKWCEGRDGNFAYEAVVINGILENVRKASEEVQSIIET
jgi:predicted PilT family ATPase